MTSTTTHDIDTSEPEGRLGVLIEGLVADVVITALIVWGFVLLGEPLRDVLTSPIFIVLTLGGLVRLASKTARSVPPVAS